MRIDSTILPKKLAGRRPVTLTLKESEEDQHRINTWLDQWDEVHARMPVSKSTFVVLHLAQL